MKYGDMIDNMNVINNVIVIVESNIASYEICEAESSCWLYVTVIHR